MRERPRWNLPCKVGLHLHILCEGSPVGVASALVEPRDVVAERVRSDVLPDEHDVAGPVAAADRAVVLHVLDDWAGGIRG